MNEFAYYNSQSVNKTEFIFQNDQHTWIPDSKNGSYPSAQVILFFQLCQILVSFLMFKAVILPPPRNDNGINVL